MENMSGERNRICFAKYPYIMAGHQIVTQCNKSHRIKQKKDTSGYYHSCYSGPVAPPPPPTAHRRRAERELVKKTHYMKL